MGLPSWGKIGDPRQRPRAVVRSPLAVAVGARKLTCRAGVGWCRCHFLGRDCYFVFLFFFLPGKERRYSRIGDQIGGELAETSRASGVGKPAGWIG